MVDAHGLGPCGAIHGGSSPLLGTMKIACIGTGFVGVVTSAVFAKLGHQVIGLDIDETKVKSLSQGKVPFFEPGLEELLQETLASGHLSFTTSYQQAISQAEVIFIMVGTPSASDGRVDLKYVFASAESLAPYLQEKAIVVIKSTVPPGTNDQVRQLIQKHTQVNFSLASVPEFLKEGSAVQDTLHPDRILLGAEDNYALTKLTQLHQPLSNNLLKMKPASAQLAKYAANNYLAQRITFINQIANLCEKTGADVQEVIQGIGHDQRIGLHYWYPGLGYGGSCFPKDVKELAILAKELGETDNLFAKINQLNQERIPRLLEQYDRLVGGFKNKTVAVWGLSFKKETNDTREAPALKLIPWLIEHGAKVRATDPKAIPEAKPQLPDQVQYFSDPYQTSKGAEAIFYLIEWPEYNQLDLAKLAFLTKPQAYFFDTRNQYDPQLIQQHGLIYKGIGR